MIRTAVAQVFLLLFLNPAVVLAQLFGKNNVQYTPFSWRVIQSRHFDVYHYQGAETIAEFVADVAESSYISISKSWDYTLKERITLIVYRSHNDFEQSNLNSRTPEESVGGFTEFFRNRIVIPYEGSYEQLRHVTHHELTHAMMLQMLYGPETSSILSGFSRAPVPLWFIEGLAEYESRGWDTESEMFVKDAVMNGSLPSIERARGFLTYKAGQSLLLFVAERYGPATIGEILIKTRFLRSFRRAVIESTGLTPELLDAEWQRYLKRKDWPASPAYRSPEEFARQLTFQKQTGHSINVSGALSPQAEQIAYLSNRSGFFDIYVASVDEPNRKRKVVRGQRSGKLEELHWLRPGITWDAEGKHIAFAAKSGDQDAIHIYHVSKRKRVRTFKLDLDAIYSPCWSPDGLRLAFVGTDRGASDIYVLDLQSGNKRKLTDDVFSDLAPQWSPDGDFLLFVSDRGDFTHDSSRLKEIKIQQTDYHQTDIYALEVRNGKIRRLTCTPANEKSPVWSPDGKKFAYVSLQSGMANIFVQSIPVSDIRDRSGLSNGTSAADSLAGTPGGEEPVAITNVLTGIDQLSWQGQRIAFTCYYEGGYDIYLMNLPAQEVPLLAAGEKNSANHSAPGIDRTDGMQPPGRLERGSPFGDFVFGDSFRNGLPVSEFSPGFTDSLAKVPQTYRESQEEYKPKLAPDILAGGVGFNPYFGLQGAIGLSFSDLLANHRLTLLTDVFVHFTSSNFVVNYLYLPRRVNLGVTAFNINTAFYSGGQVPVRDRNIGVDISISRPFDRFHRLDAGLSVRRITRSRFEGFPGGTEAAFEQRAVQVALFHLAYVRDTVLWGNGGPRAGDRFNFTVATSPDVGADGLDFRIYRFDYRTYHSFARRYVLFFRVTGGLSEGRHKQSFYLGGLDNWINFGFREGLVLNLQEQYFSSIASPVRGYDFYERIGSKFLLTNIELRMSLVNNLQLGVLPLQFSDVGVVLFTDSGQTWDASSNSLQRPGSPDETPLISFGWGIRFGLGFLRLRYDMAWRANHGISGAVGLFSIGADL